MVLISVIVPVYKVEPYLRRCVDSILNQTFKDFELILVNDGSPDCCPTICDEYATKDNRVVTIHKENGGLSSARNAGIEYALSNSNSEYITFIDSDDWVSNDYLLVLLNSFNKAAVDVVMCGVYEVNDDNKIITSTDVEDKSFLFEGKDFIIIQYNNNVYSTAWSKLYKKSSLNNIRFLNNVTHEDEYFVNDYYTRGITCLYVSKKLYFYNKNNNNSIMNNRTSRDYCYYVDALIKRYRLVKRKLFMIDESTKEKLLDSILWCNVSYNQLTPSRTGVFVNVFKIIVTFPNNKKYLKKKIKLLIGSFGYFFGLKKNHFLIDR